MDLGLKNRVALVAASSLGIGRAAAEAFASEGCKLAMCARTQDVLDSAAASIREQYNVDVLAKAFDVADPKAVKAFVDDVVAKFGSVDICVTNAGGPPAKGFLATTVDEWQSAVEGNDQEVSTCRTGRGIEWELLGQGVALVLEASGLDLLLS